MNKNLELFLLVKDVEYIEVYWKLILKMRVKIKCPFTHKGVKQTTYDDWMLIVKCGKNNYNGTQYLKRHFFANCLSKEEINMLVEISKNNIKLKEILNSLKQNDELNYSTLRTIYNAKYNYRLQNLS